MSRTQKGADSLRSALCLRSPGFYTAGEPRLLGSHPGEGPRPVARPGPAGATLPFRSYKGRGAAPLPRSHAPGARAGRKYRVRQAGRSGEAGRRGRRPGSAGCSVPARPGPGGPPGLPFPRVPPSSRRTPGAGRAGLRGTEGGAGREGRTQARGASPPSRPGPPVPVSWYCFVWPGEGSLEVIDQPQQ